MLNIDEMVSGLIAGRELAYPVPKNICEGDDMVALRLLLKKRGYEIPAWPPGMYGGSHYRLKALKIKRNAPVGIEKTHHPDNTGDSRMATSAAGHGKPEGLTP